MSAIDPQGNEKYWINGIAYEGLRFQPSKVGENTYWFEGRVEENITPLQNFDTSKYFLIFE